MFIETGTNRKTVAPKERNVLPDDYVIGQNAAPPELRESLESLMSINIRSLRDFSRY